MASEEIVTNQSEKNDQVIVDTDDVPEESEDEEDEEEDESVDEVGIDVVDGFEDLDEYFLPKPLKAKDVTRSHTIRKSERSQCQNVECAVTFKVSSRRRAHHCRRCGDVFCQACLRYRRRLDRMAQIDPHGVHCKVCFRCYEERPLSWGPLTRSRTKEFESARAVAMDTRQKAEFEQTLQRQTGSVVPLFWKEQFNVDVLHEGKRLLSGFKTAVGSSEALRAIHEIRGDLVKVPAWQKSDFWKLDKSQTTCRQCNERDKKHRRNCRVCGMALCKVCSTKELLLYYDDKDKPIKAHTEPRLVIIREDPAPEIQPSISLCLFVCADCRTEIVRRQQVDPDWFKLETRPLEGLTLLQHLDQTFGNLQRDIVDVSPLEATSEHLAGYLSEFKRLENLQEDRNFKGKRQTLLLNYIKAKRDFYWTIRRKVTSEPVSEDQEDSVSSEAPLSVSCSISDDKSLNSSSKRSS